jgi:hypothetical protein
MLATVSKLWKTVLPNNVAVFVNEMLVLETQQNNMYSFFCVWYNHVIMYAILINTAALGLIVLQLTAPRSHTMAKRLFEVGDDLDDGASSAKPKSGQPLMPPLIEWKARKVTKSWDLLCKASDWCTWELGDWGPWGPCWSCGGTMACVAELRQCPCHGQTYMHLVCFRKHEAQEKRMHPAQKAGEQEAADENMGSSSIASLFGNVQMQMQNMDSR